MAKLLEAAKLYVLDGGLATEIERNGNKIQDDPLWSARFLCTSSGCKVIKEVHKSFLQAGADIIETASYQAALDLLTEQLGIEGNKCKEIVKMSVTVAKQAIQETCCNALVAGSVGPYAVLRHDGSEYSGAYIASVDRTAAIDYFYRQIVCLTEAGADLLAFETIPSLAEAELICLALEQFSSSRIPDAWISMSCKNGEQTCAGDDFCSVTKSLFQKPYLLGVGINCTAPNLIGSLLKIAQQAKPTSKVLAVYPNSGEQWQKDRGWKLSTEKYDWSQLVPQWLNLGSKVIGGCCRTTPADISSIKKEILKYYSNDFI